MILIEAKSLTKYDVVFRQTSGNEAIFCPVCKDDRKAKNKNDKPLSFDHGKGCGMCHNCEATFTVKKENEVKTNYIRPVFNNTTTLSERVVKWFQGRSISQETLSAVKITEGSEWMPQTGKPENTIQFNYFRDGQLINTKFREHLGKIGLIEYTYNMENSRFDNTLSSDYSNWMDTRINPPLKQQSIDDFINEINPNDEPPF